MVKVKRFAIEPMFEEDAVAQMEELGHQFFVFVSAETERVAVLYRRRDGDYGLIEPVVGGDTRRVEATPECSGPSSRRATIAVFFAVDGRSAGRRHAGCRAEGRVGGDRRRGIRHAAAPAPRRRMP